MLKYRLISFPLLLALVGAVFFWEAGGPWIFAALSVILASMAVYEMCRMLAGMGFETFPRFTAGLAALFSVGMLLVLLSGSRVWMSCGVLILAALLFLLPLLPWMLILRRKDGAFRKLFVSFGVLFMTLIPLFMVQGAWELFPWRKGMSLFFLILVTKSMDTGGYIFGMLSNRYLPGGNHKIAPAISPKKSYEGFFGGILLAIGVSIAFCYGGISPFPLWFYIVCAVVLALGSFAGDLTESALKRACNIKDSGNWIPGMGGAFDVLDSFLYNGVLFYLLTMAGRGMLL